MKTLQARAYIKKLADAGIVKLEAGKLVFPGIFVTKNGVTKEPLLLSELVELNPSQVADSEGRLSPLADTRKRVSDLLKAGVSLETLKSLLAEMESGNGEDTFGGHNAGGETGETGTLPGNGTEGPATAEVSETGGEGGDGDNPATDGNGNNIGSEPESAGRKGRRA